MPIELSLDALDKAVMGDRRGGRADGPAAAGPSSAAEEEEADSFVNPDYQELREVRLQLLAARGELPPRT